MAAAAQVADATIDEKLRNRQNTHNTQRWSDIDSRQSRNGKHFPVQRFKKTNPVMKTRVKQLDLANVRPKRAGGIIYTEYGGATFFGLGIDSKSHDITDFGGGMLYTICKPNSTTPIDRDVVHGALREFREETLGIFEDITVSDVESCPVIYDSANLIIFIRMDVNPDTVCKKFNNTYTTIMKNPSSHNIPEICGITWLSWQQFQAAINDNNTLYARVRNFLHRADGFEELL